MFAANKPRAPNIQTGRAPSDEQYRFALDVLMDHPLNQQCGGAGTYVGVSDSEISGELKKEIETGREYFAGMCNSATYLHTMPIGSFSVLACVAAGLGLVCLMTVPCSRGVRTNSEAAGIRIFSALVLFVVVANAVFCGVLSGPRDRYEVRVIWLILVLVLIIHFRVYDSWWSARFARLKEWVPACWRRIRQRWQP